MAGIVSDKKEKKDRAKGNKQNGSDRKERVEVEGGEKESGKTRRKENDIQKLC